MTRRSTIVLIALAVAGGTGACTSERGRPEAVESQEQADAGRRFKVEIVGAW